MDFVHELNMSKKPQAHAEVEQLNSTRDSISPTADSADMEESRRIERQQKTAKEHLQAK